MDQLLAFDHELFIAINNGMSNVFFDWLMPIMRNPYTWAPLYLFIIVFCIKQYKKQGILIIVSLLITFGISDFVSSSIIKKSVQRVRPCHEVELKEDVIVRVRCGGSYSFTSSHATNHFALALFLIVVFYRRWKHVLWLGLAWAAIISYAQIYVGVHYPLDIAAGMILGCIIGCITGYLYRYISSVFFPSEVTT